MASSPSYGDRPPLQSYRRSFTVPPRVLSVHERAGLNEADADSNILYSHPSARIIAFSPPTDSIPQTSKETLPETDYPVDTIETLPWRSRTEMLAATGPIVIEKVRGSSHFLKSADQNVIQSIMRNSQCWCVDGKSKFVLRRGKFRYYRIELPSETEADKEKVKELKAVLSKVLRFERTPCPFKRAFHVDLPDDAITPRRKGTWTRKPTPVSTTPNTDPLPLQRTKTSRTWSLQGQSTPTPLHTYGRRGSDYGFTTSRGPSPRPQYDIDGYRPATPSSLVSSEEVSDSRHEGHSIEHAVHQDKTHLERAEGNRHLEKSEPPRPSLAHVHADTIEQEGQSGTEKPEPGDTADHPSIIPIEISPQEPMQKQREAEIKPTETLLVEASGDNVFEKVDKRGDEWSIMMEDDHLPVSGQDVIHVPENDLSVEDGHNGSSVETREDSAQEHGSTEAERCDRASEPAGIIDSYPPDDMQDRGLASSQAEEPEPAAVELRDPASDDDTLSRVSSADSFHTSNSLTHEALNEQVEVLDFEDTPQAEEFDPHIINIRQHRREVSELTVTASTVDEHSERNVDFRPSTSDSLEQSSTPALGPSSASESSWPDVQTPSPVNDSQRRRFNLKRSLSPLPPSTTLFSPSPSPSQGGQFTAVILHKACNVALVKPVEAVVLLVHILARIAGGATVNDLLSGDLFRRPEQHRRRSSFPDQVSPFRPDSDDEDDFSVPRHRRGRSVEVKSTATAIQDGDADSIFELD